MIFVEDHIFFVIDYDRFPSIDFEAGNSTRFCLIPADPYPESSLMNASNN
jgi:hypothetical protein